MAGKKTRRSKPRKPLRETLSNALSAALETHDDFIVVFETVPDEEQRVHVMTGKLISPCMLGTLTNRCEIQVDEGSRHRILSPDTSGRIICRNQTKVKRPFYRSHRVSLPYRIFRIR